MEPLLYYNFSGRDFPDYSIESFNSMAVCDGKVTARDFGLETLQKFKFYKKVDLEKAVLLPAFADAHTHFLQTGLMSTGCRLEDCCSLLDVFDLLKSSCAKNSSEWVIAWNLDETKLKEKRLPSVAELDKISTHTKIWINRVDLHSGILNSVAINWAKKIAPNVSFKDGRIARNDYYFLFGKLIESLPREEKLLCLTNVKKQALQHGVTSVHALEGGPNISTEDVQLVADFLLGSGFHGVVYHQSEDPSLALKNGWPRLGGCLFVDGSFGSRTAALFEPYADDPENYGEIYRNQEVIERLLRICSRNNLQLAMHAIGDRAISLLTQVYEWGIATFGTPQIGHRIEHFELPDDSSIKLARSCGLLISVQPAFEVFWGGPGNMYSLRLGESRRHKTNPFRTMQNFGIPLAGGSDSPVTPINPFLGIHGFVNHPNSEEAIDLNSALAAFIVEPHRFIGEEKQRGKLLPGYYADFVCLSEDPFLVNKLKLKELKIKRTFVGGIEVSLQ